MSHQSYKMLPSSSTYWRIAFMNSSSSSAHSGSHSFAGTPMSVSICDTDQKLSEHTDLDFTWRIAGVNFWRFLRRFANLLLTTFRVSLSFSTWRLSPRNGQPLGSISLSRDGGLFRAAWWSDHWIRSWQLRGPISAMCEHQFTCGCLAGCYLLSGCGDAGGLLFIRSTFLGQSPGIYSSAPMEVDH